jgi:Transmembrane secretion effector
VTGVRAAAAPLASPAFRRYLAGQLPSVTCSWAQVITLSWVVVELNPRALGLVVALQFLPSLALGPWFGAVADRHDRRRLLMLAEAGLGVVAAGYALASASGVLTMPLICLLATVWGIINALDTPARRALLPLLVRPDQAASASALAGTVLLLGMTAGSALGGVLVTTAGAAIAFTFNAASFLADVIVLHTIRASASPLVRRAPRQVRDGLGYVWRTPALRTPLLALAVIATLAFSVQVSVPTLVRASFGGGASLMGTAFTAVTAGSLAGTLLGAARGAPGPRAIPRAAAIMAGSMVTVAVAPTAAVAIAGLAGVGLAWSLVLISVIAVLQSADPRMLGRVVSLFAVVLLGGTSAGGPIAASVAAAAGPRAPFLLGAGACLAAMVIVGASRPGVPWGDRHGVADGGALQGHGAIVTDHGGADLGDRLVGPGLEDLHAAGNDVARADGRREVPVHVEKHGPRAGQAPRDDRVEYGAGYPALDDDLAEP